MKNNPTSGDRPVRKPAWLKKNLIMDPAAAELYGVLKKNSLATVCEAAACPNRCECFSRKRVTFMILGEICSRTCAFCGVTHGSPSPVDPGEPERVAHAAASLGLRHVVVTSVTRDDLPDGGAGHFVQVVRALRGMTPRPVIEILIPDFQGQEEAITLSARSGADIVNHNIETISRLYPSVRPQADYRRSLELLSLVKTAFPSVTVKSGLMVGLGERSEEIRLALGDLHSAGCDMVTIGQYLPPSRAHRSASAFITPSIFEEYADEARRLGFISVASGPFVRSSLAAEETYRKMAFQGGDISS